MSTFPKFTSLKPRGRLKPNFIWSLLGTGERKFFSNGPGHLTKMAVIPIYGKKSSSLEPKADDLETWYAESGARVLPSCSNDDTGLTLTYFTARSNLLPYAFVWEKCKTMAVSETIVIYDLELATDDRSDKKFLLTTLTSKFLSPGDCMPPAPGLYTCIKS